VSGRTALPVGVVLGLDIGTVRTGVARGNTLVRLASPLVTLPMNDEFMAGLKQVIHDQQALALVLGLPRNLQGEDTQQTQYVRDFAEKIRAATDLSLYFVDEALTSEKAERELAARKKPYNKGDIDALAACYILEDALEGNYHAQEV
jgi:putative Holliday junction resolvase